MPLYTVDDKGHLQEKQGKLFLDTPTEESSLSATAGSVFAQDNLLGSIVSNEYHKLTGDETFIPSIRSAAEYDYKHPNNNEGTKFEKLALDQHGEARAEILTNIQRTVRTDQQFDSYMSKVKREDKYSDIIANADDSTVLGLGLAAAVVDVDFVSLLGAIGPITKLRKAKMSRARSGAEGSAKLGAFGALSSYATEEALLQSQETRPDMRIDAIIGGAVLGSLFGGSVGLLRGSKMDSLEFKETLGRQFQDMMDKGSEYLPAKGERAADDPSKPFGDSSVGAAQADQTTLEMEGRYSPNKVTDLLNRYFSFDRVFVDNKVAQLQNAMSLRARKFVNSTANSINRLNKNKIGIATVPGGSFESRLEVEMQGRFIDFQERYKDHYHLYRTGDERKMMDASKAEIQDFMGKIPQGKLSDSEFNSEVSRALMDRDLHHDIPEVQKAAKMVHDELFRPIFDEYVDMGLLDPETSPSTAENYLPIWYDTNAINANPADFDRVVSEWYSQQMAIKDGLKSEIMPKYEEYKTLLKNKELSEGDASQLASMEQELIDLVAQWDGKSTKYFKTLLQKGEDGADLRKALNNSLRRIEKSNTRLTDQDLLDIASETRNRITAHDEVGEYSQYINDDGSITKPQGDGNFSYGASNKLTPSHLKGRLLQIPQKVLFDNGFIHTNAFDVARRHHYNALPFIEWHKHTGGDVELTKVKSEVRLDYNTITRDKDLYDKLQDDFSGDKNVLGEKVKSVKAKVKAKEPLDDAEREILQYSKFDAKYQKYLSKATPTKIQKEMSSALQALDTIREMALGRHGRANFNPDSGVVRISRGLRNFNVISKMEDIVVSSFSDVMRILMQPGIYKSGLATVIKTMKKDPSLFKMKQQELARFSGVFEIMSNAKFNTMADLHEPYNPKTMVEKGVEYLTSKFPYVSGAAYWNHYNKTLVAIAHEDEILRGARQLAEGTASDEVKELLAFSNIDKDFSKRIIDQFDKYGFMQEDSGLNVLGANDWDDVAARMALGSATNKAINLFITTPGMDRPALLTSHPGLQLLGQFKTFYLTATDRILYNSAQNIEKANYQKSLLLGLISGMMVYQLKMARYGRETSDDVTTWVMEGLNYMGVMGVFGEYANTADKIGFGPRRLLGGDLPSKYYSRSAVASFVGPSYSIPFDIVGLMNSISTKGELSQKDKNFIYGSIPYAGHPFITYPSAAIKGLSSQGDTE